MIKYAFILKPVWFWEIYFRTRKFINWRWWFDDTYLSSCQCSYRCLGSFQEDDRLCQLSTNACI